MLGPAITHLGSPQHAKKEKSPLRSMSPLLVISTSIISSSSQTYPVPSLNSFVRLPSLSLLLGRPLWWVDLGRLPDACSATLSVPLLDRTGGENEIEELVGRDEDREITDRLLSQAKLTQLGEN